MRRLLFAALVVALTASAALAAPRTVNDRIACEDVKALDLLFWPHGHRMIPVFGPDSALPVPHMEIYRAGVTAGSGLLGFVGTTGWNLSPGCRVVDEQPFVRWGGGTKRIATGTARIRCRFPGTVELKTSPLRSAAVSPLLLAFRLAILSGWLIVGLGLLYAGPRRIAMAMRLSAFISAIPMVRCVASASEKCRRSSA